MCTPGDAGTSAKVIGSIARMDSILPSFDDIWKFTESNSNPK